VRRMLRVLKEEGRVGMLIDQRVKPHEGIAVPFFGTPCWTSPLRARLALPTGAPIVPAFGDHLPGGRYAMRLLAPIVPDGAETDESARALTERCLEVVTEAIRLRPESWFWLHERWKGFA
jgi:Kdo2-lipid IVA lauroyltransferase/acyltransferase